MNGPLFTLEKHASHFWVCDNGRRTLLFVKQRDGLWICNAVFLRQPGVGEAECPQPYHTAVAVGVQLDFAWRWSGDWLPMECQEARLTNASAELSFARRLRDGRGGQDIVLTLRRNPDGGYVLGGKTSLVVPASGGCPKRVEFLNFMPADAASSWADRKRFRATLHEASPGTFEIRPHSHLGVLERHFWEYDPNFRKPHVPEPPLREIHNQAHRGLGPRAPYALSHFYKPLCCGGIVFMEGESVTPAVRVLDASGPVSLTTCDVFFDEHMVVETGEPQGDGSFRYGAEYEVFHLPEPEVAAALSHATEAAYSDWVEGHEFAPFFCDRVNRFDAPASRAHEGACGVFFSSEDPGHLVSWRRNAGPEGGGAIVLNTCNPLEPTSGQHYQSVRYNLRGAPWIEAFPLGFFLHVLPGMTVEFSARIRIEGGATAWLELREAVWGHFQRDAAFLRPGRREDVPILASTVSGHGGHSVSTETVTSNDWSRVEGHFTATIPDGMSMVFLVMEGAGRAFFSELEVKRV